VDEGLPFAGWLRERRVLAGLTQAQLADRAGLSLRAVRNAELGSVRRPRPETERRLREALAEAPPEPVRIGVLGPLTVLRGDCPVEIGAEKQLLLLALLALHRVQRAELVAGIAHRLEQRGVVGSHGGIRVGGGAVQLRIHAELPLADAGRAHQLLASRATQGKLLLTP